MSARPCRAGLALALVAAAAGPLRAQRLPLERGDRVRLTLDTLAPMADWITGTVWSANRDYFWLTPSAVGATHLIPFSDSLHLEVRDGRHSHAKLGGVLGLVLGGLGGATVLSSTFGREHLSDGQASAAGALLYGFAGAMAGGLIGARFGSSRWIDVPIEHGRLPAAPLVAPAEPRPTLTRPYRWTRFPPTDADFAAFFQAHADSLLTLEGLWEGESGDRMAIVRLAGVEGFAFGAFSVARAADAVRESGDGLLTFVLTPPASDGTLDVRRAALPLGPVVRSHVSAGRLRDDALFVTFAGRVFRWIKVSLTAGERRE